MGKTSICQMINMLLTKPKKTEPPFGTAPFLSLVVMSNL
jgi:hypothetical protein